MPTVHLSTTSGNTSNNKLGAQKWASGSYRWLPSTDRSATAFALAKKLVENKVVEPKSVEQFITLMNTILKVL